MSRMASAASSPVTRIRIDSRHQLRTDPVFEAHRRPFASGRRLGQPTHDFTLREPDRRSVAQSPGALLVEKFIASLAQLAVEIVDARPRMPWMIPRMGRNNFLFFMASMGSINTSPAGDHVGRNGSSRDAQPRVTARPPLRWEQTMISGNFLVSRLHVPLGREVQIRVRGDGKASAIRTTVWRSASDRTSPTLSAYRPTSVPKREMARPCWPKRSVCGKTTSSNT